jgi:hypothetical protein
MLEERGGSISQKQDIHHRGHREHREGFSKKSHLSLCPLCSLWLNFPSQKAKSCQF